MGCNRQAAAMGLPELTYPVPVIVRNTFIDTPALRRWDSLDEFLKERKAFSCPPETPAGSEQEEERAGDTCQGFKGWASGLDSLADWLRPSVREPAGYILESSVASSAEHEVHQPFDLAEEFVEPQLGSEELPTIGSQGHHLRQCKPCAFVHTKGCDSGVQCTFCHLCGLGEKKMRKKEKRAVRRQACERRQQNTMMIAPLKVPGIQNFPYFCW